MNKEMPEPRTLASVQALLTNPDLGDPESDLIREMYSMGGFAEEAAALLSEAAEETVGGIMANAMSHMSWLKSRGWREMTSGSDLRAIDINNGRTVVYFAPSPGHMQTHVRGLRVVSGAFVRAVMKGRKEKGKRQTLFFFPEFFALGHMDLLARSNQTLL